MSSTFIKDCIYQFIEIPELCKAFADTFEFQRLRYIKQLGFVSFVYPSAVHTRLEHSFGVMHLAGRMVDALRATANISDREKELVQLAGMLHDTGHIAFSHLFDYILTEQGEEGHEERSVKVLRIINSRLQLLSNREEDMVAKMILGNSENEEKEFLYEIVSNSLCGIDVDRLDYLQRDAYHTGIPGFQPDYLLRCARVVDNHICFLHKAFTEVQLLYETRKRMFLLVYRHKTVMRIERVIRQIVKDLDIFHNWSANSWLGFDDVECISQLRRSPLFQTLYTRSWAHSEVDDMYRHCTCIYSEQIDEQLEKVLFTNE